MFYYFDPTYILLIIGAVISIAAQSRVKSVYAQYSKVMSASNITGAEAARRILNSANIYNVSIERIKGTLTDCYVPSKKILYLSDSTYNSTSIAAIGVAAHECGHAIQDATEYTPLTLANTVSPACRIGSSIGIYVVMAGLIFSYSRIITIGLVLFALGVAISLLTLPIEYNASNRALAAIKAGGILTADENEGAEKVLRAAGLTYVAAAAASVLSLLRLVLISGRRNRR